MESNPNKKRNILMVLGVIIVIIMIVILFRENSKKNSSESSYGKDAQNKRIFSEDEVILRDKMRKLWSDHVFLTRAYVVDYFNNSKETPVTGKRLMQNQED